MMSSRIAMAFGVAMLLPAMAIAQSPKGWYLQLGPAVIDFNEGTSLSLGGAKVPGADVSVSREGTLGVGLGYFFTPNLSVILIGGTPPTSTIEGSGTIEGLTAGKIKYAPAILAGNYHFRQFEHFQPFVGGGITYTAILSEDSQDIADLKADSAWGGVVRAGFDYLIDDRQGIFFSAQKLFVSTSVSGVVASHVPGLAGAPVSADIDLNPLILHAGYTIRF